MNPWRERQLDRPVPERWWHLGPRLDRAADIWVLAAGLCVGTALWLACTSGWTEPDSEPWRSWTFSVAIVGSSAAAGWLTRTDHQLIAASLVAPGALLAGWTTPRGDDDGLWMVIYILLGILGVGAAGAALAARAMRSALRQKRSL